MAHRSGWRIAVIAVLATLALAAGVLIGSRLGERPTAAPGPTTVVVPAPTAAPPTPTTATAAQTPLRTDFAEFQPSLHAKAGIAISPVGAAKSPITLGDWQTGPAWSTIKVPLAIAALRAADSTTPTDSMRAAITESDNAAAEAIWASLGDPVTAAHDVEAVLKPTGDPTVVQSQRVRPEYTAFGQTDWSLTNQLAFVAEAACDPSDAPIFDLMGQVEPDQSWGIGTIPGTRFKGGWGPSPTGEYLVRQMGVLTTDSGRVAVTLAAQPDSGSFDDGTAALTQMAGWLKGHLAELPAGQCGS